jgi:phosphoglycolate phosphatase
MVFNVISSNTLQNIDFIVFDWDGTLMDSTGLIALCIQLASREIGLSAPTDADAKHIIGLGPDDSSRILFPDLDEAKRLELAFRYRRHFVDRDHEAPLFPGVKMMLEDLRNRGIMLGVATGKTRPGLERAFEQTGLKAMFDFSRCADEGFPKPHPDMLLKLMAFAGRDKERVLMIGDTTHDLELAANAGVRSVAVSYGAHSESELLRHEPMKCFQSVDALHTWLSKNV